MIKFKTKQAKTEKFETYRKHRNKITHLIRIGRQSYYQNCFKQNKNNSKILWQGINYIIYCKKDIKSTRPSSLIVEEKNMTHPQDIAEHFNRISLSRHEQVCLMGLLFARYFSHHRQRK